MKNIILNLIHAYKAHNQSEFEELVEASLTLPLEELLSLNEYLENAYPCIREAYDDVLRDMEYRFQYGD